MPLNPEARRARARLAANARHHPDKPELAAADLAEIKRAQIDGHIDAIDKAGRAGMVSPEQRARIRETVATWPLLTGQQRQRLAPLLDPGHPGDTA